MSESNCYSCSLSRRVTVTLHSLYGGDGGNRTRVRNSYMNRTFLRNSQYFAYALRRGAAMIGATATQGVPVWCASTTLFLYPVIRKTARRRCIFNLRHLPIRRCVVLEDPYTDQAATFSATRAAKVGWIMMTVSVLSFRFDLSLGAVFYLRVPYSRNPVEPITSPY